MTPEEFRAAYHELGPIAEVIIANVIVGNFSWKDAIRVADAIMHDNGLGRYAKIVVS